MRKDNQSELQVFPGWARLIWVCGCFSLQGSLTDFLKANVVSWNELCHIAQTMARGLAYLHEDIPGLKDGHKPAISHRYCPGTLLQAAHHPLWACRDPAAPC